MTLVGGGCRGGDELSWKSGVTGAVVYLGLFLVSALLSLVASFALISL